MLISIKAALVGSFFSTTLWASLALAAVDAVPNFDVEPSCQAAARQAATADYVSVCRNAERKARDQMKQEWPRLNSADKAQCVPAARAGGTLSYAELLTCLELARDVRQLHGKREPSMTGQAVK